MTKFTHRITKRIQLTVDNFLSDCQFSPYLALTRLIADTSGRIGFHKLALDFRTKQEEWIHSYLKKNLEHVLKHYAHDNDFGEFTKNAPIWVCWWTGEDTAPHLVNSCINSIRKNAGTHTVHLITKDNYSSYLDIPPCILDKINDPKFRIAHLADYIRVALLAKYGGLWVDATIFATQTIPETYFDIPVFTLKGPVGPCGYISEKRWVTFCLGGWRGNVLYRFLRDAFEFYWSQNNIAVDYLFFDHIILLAYEHLPSVYQLLNDIPENNLHRDDLQAAMNAATPSEEFNNVIQPETVLYKLSWRENYALLSTDGLATVYQHILEME